jgi:hypothetical protein
LALLIFTVRFGDQESGAFLFTSSRPIPNMHITQVTRIGEVSVTWWGRRRRRRRTMTKFRNL